MNAIIRKLVILVAVIMTVLSINPKQAKADIPPEIWHCTSQEQCFALLTPDNVIITREGVVKGTITDIGSGEGSIAVSNGYVIVTRTNSNLVYIHDLLTGIQCNIDVGERPCYPGVVALSYGGLYYAHVICPTSEYLKRIWLDCSQYVEIPSDGPTPTKLAESPDEYLFVGYGDSLVGIMTHPNAGIPRYVTDLAFVTDLTYHEGTSSVYMNGSLSNQNGIYSKPVPMSHGTAALFQALPQGTNYIASGQTHLAVSGTMWDGYIIDVANPAGMVTVTLDETKECAISPATPGEAVRAYFIENAISGTVIRVFDETGTEMAYSPIETPSWDLAYIAPVLPPACNNGLAEPGETCDATDFNGASCITMGFDGGTLSCGAACDEVFTSECWACGDGNLNPGETCDGTDLGAAVCGDVGLLNGNVSCNLDCTANYDECYTCGNSLVEGAENCEGNDLQGQTCESIGFLSGTLTCGTDCMFDTSSCSMCGDGIANNGELCDGEDTPGKICQTMGLGFTGGQLLCNSACGDYDDSQCYTCGDGNVNLTEECDGANLNEQTCESLGLGSGTLSCFENCTFNLNGCSDVPAEYCGNGTTDPGEECDDGNRSNEDDCSETCRIIPPTCGVDPVGIDPGETCDGTDLGGETCQTLGYEAGILYCGADCQLRTEDCHFISTPQTISLQLDAEPEPGELDETLMTQYEALKSTLTPQCTSQEVNGDLVMSTVPGSYCAMRARVLDSPTGEKMFSFIYIPENNLENENPVVRFYQNGDIAQNFGGQITAFQGLQVKTVLAGDRLRQITQERISSMGMKFLSVHPDPKNQTPGRWLALDIGLGSTKFCTDEAGVNCAMFVPQLGQIVINLDALEDLSNIGWTPPKDGGGCSCQTGSNNSNSSLPLIFLMIATFLVVRRRRSLRK